MRDYSKISQSFWTGHTGKKLREYGPETQLLALYLVSSPHTNMHWVRATVRRARLAVNAPQPPE